MLHASKSMLGRSVVVLTFASASMSHAIEWKMESEIASHLEYNDNIFLTTLPHDAVTGFVVTPSIDFIAEAENWESSLEGKVDANTYSDETLDSTDLFIDSQNRYLAEKHIYSLNFGVDYDTNLNSESSDFGITGQQVERQIKRITPGYTWLKSERTALFLDYSISDVEYIDPGNSGFVSYEADVLSGSMLHAIDQRNNLTLLLQYVDYVSKDQSFEYDLITSQIGVETAISETLDIDYSIGNTHRDSTSTSVQVIDFFGQTITRSVVTDFTSKGLVLNAGFEQDFERGTLSGRLSQDNTTDSFGGLNEIRSFLMKYNHRVSETLVTRGTLRFEDIESVGGVNSFSDREVLYFTLSAYRKLARDLKAGVSYRYIARRFDSQGDVNAPDSNRVLFEISYNFPPISTF